MAQRVAPVLSFTSLAEGDATTQGTLDAHWAKINAFTLPAMECQIEINHLSLPLQ
jgi:hypothetical protein